MSDDTIETLAKMQLVANQFYSKAVQLECHAFIEFTGLMNEYITILRRAEREGIDLTRTNVHGGGTRKIQDFEIAYIAEKFGCIFNAYFQDTKDQERFVRGLGWSVKIEEKK